MTRDNAYLFDILESAKLALEHIGDIKRDEFEKDILLQDAVVRRLEIIGEATRRISIETELSTSSLERHAWNAKCCHS